MFGRLTKRLADKHGYPGGRTVPHDEEVLLGGFILELDFHKYQSEFYRAFPHLRCRRGDDNLIRYWTFDGRKRNVTKADQGRVEYWHRGYRGCLQQLNPREY